MTICHFCHTDQPFSGFAARVPEGKGRGHICNKCIQTGKYDVVGSNARQVQVEVKSNLEAARNDKHRRRRG